MHRNALVNNTDLEIVDCYNAQTRGICNYYSMASNYGRLDYFVYLMEYSCLKTLARKHQRSIGQIIDKYRYGKIWAIPYDTKSGKKYMSIVRFTDMRAKRKSKYLNNVDIVVKPHYGFNELDKRISAKKCELCGAENISFEIHHINKLKNLKGKELWEKIMISRKRKTLVVCKKCHYKIHGEPDTLRGVSPVPRGDCANLLQKCNKAALSYSTPRRLHLEIITKCRKQSICLRKSRKASLTPIK